jgi:mRNA interferase MazF
MVKQGDIIWLNFSPTRGSEQSGRHPALVLSNSKFIHYTNGFAIVAPISSSDNGFPLHIKIEDNLAIKGFILTEHIRSVDLNARAYTLCDTVSDDFLKNILNIADAMFENERL